MSSLCQTRVLTLLLQKVMRVSRQSKSDDDDDVTVDKVMVPGLHGELLSKDSAQNEISNVLF